MNSRAAIHRVSLQLALCAALLLLLSAVNTAAAAAGKTQIWFSLVGYKDPVGRASWDRLFFRPDAPWPDFMNYVDVLQLLTQQVVGLPNKDLAKVTKRLKEHNVAMSVAMLAQAYDKQAHCGANVEGYFPPEQTAVWALKLRQNGADLKYLAMDEPLWFGHYYNGPSACHSTIERVAELVAENVRAYKKQYPNVAVGDGLPVPSFTDQPNWQADLKHWMQAFNSANGQPLAFIQLDIDWQHKNWEQSVKALSRFLRGMNMPFGIVYNAPPGGSAMTNEQWLESAKRNFVHIEKELHIEPDQVTFASWARYPRRSVSDQSGLGEDWLVKEYVREK